MEKPDTNNPTSLEQKGIIHILAIFLLLAGIIAGIYLVQRTQIFKPKASVETVDLSLQPSRVTIAPGERFTLNVFVNTKNFSLTAAEIHVSFETQGNFSLEMVQPENILPVRLSIPRTTTEDGKHVMIITLGVNPDYIFKGTGVITTIKGMVSTPTTFQFTNKTRVTVLEREGNVDTTFSPAIITISSPVSPTPTPTLTPTPTPALSSSFTNTSSRGFVQTGHNILIGGFIIKGNSSKRVLILGKGPSLSEFGLPDTLTNPFLRLFSGSTSIAENDDWESQRAAIVSTGLDPCQPNPGRTTPPPNCTRESAILTTLEPGLYTVHLTGINSGVGVGLVEVFDVDTANPTQLTNVSSRGFVQTGHNILVHGFIIGGNSPQKVLIRGRGPSLAAFSLSNTLANPYMRLFSGTNVINENDNWEVSPNRADIASSGLDPCQPFPGQTSPPPDCSREATILTTLDPGAYTVYLTGVGDTSGLGLIEVLNVP